MYVNVGKEIINRYKNKFSIKKNTNQCCWKNCRQESECTYMGYPLCDKHMEWLEKKIDLL